MRTNVQKYCTRALKRSLWAWRRRPFPGPFALAVLYALRDEVVASREGSSLWVHADRLERGDNPFVEEFSVRFRLTAAMLQWVPESVEVSDGPIGVTEYIDSQELPGPGGVPVRSDTHYFFRFKKVWGLAGSMARFRTFVRDRLDGEGAPLVNIGEVVRRQPSPGRFMATKTQIPGRKHKA